MREILTDFIAGLPKAQLHLHIEGTLTPALKRQFADRNKMSLGDKSFAALKIYPATASPEAQSAFHINQYKMFLYLYYEGVKVLQTRKISTILRLNTCAHARPTTFAIARSHSTRRRTSIAALRWGP